MNFFRAHIIQSFNVGFLLVGIAFYFLKPVGTGSEHDAFAQWLQSNLKTNTDSEITNEIRDLRYTNGQLDSVIREASSIVKTYADNFELPLDEKSQDENEVYKLLLKEWTNYQNSSTGMGKAVVIKQGHPHSYLPNDGFSPNSKLINGSISLDLTLAQESIEDFYSNSYRFNLCPLKGGIAINAP